MTKGRQLRLAFLASFVALLFGVVTIAHAGSHLGADSRVDSAASCALCHNTTNVNVAPVLVSAPVVAVESVVLADSTVLVTDAPRAHLTRGPPEA